MFGRLARHRNNPKLGPGEFVDNGDYARTKSDISPYALMRHRDFVRYPSISDTRRGMLFGLAISIAMGLIVSRDKCAAF